MKIYKGNDEIKASYKGTNSINSGGTLFGIVNFPTYGLVALYNPKATGGYSSGTVYDLSSNGNDVSLSGNYSISTGSGYENSIFMGSGSYGVTSTNLSTSLHGTGSEFTIVSFTANYNDGGSAYVDPTWWIGGPTSSIDQKQIYNGKEWSSLILGIGVSNVNYTSYAAVNPWVLYDNIDSTTDASAFWIGTNDQSSDAWSFQAVSKRNQTLTYVSASTNLTLYAKGYGVQNPHPYGQWKSANLLNSDFYGYAYTNPANIAPQFYPVITGSAEDAGFLYNQTFEDTGNTFSTNLDNSILTINPSSGNMPNIGEPGAYRNFHFGGMVVYDRVLSSQEVEFICNYFNSFY